MSLISMYKLFTTFYRDILISFFEIKLNVDSAILMNFNFVFTNNNMECPFWKDLSLSC